MSVVGPMPWNHDDPSPLDPKRPVPADLLRPLGFGLAGGGVHDPRSVGLDLVDRHAFGGGSFDELGPGVGIGRFGLAGGAGLRDRQLAVLQGVHRRWRGLGDLGGLQQPQRLTHRHSGRGRQPMRGAAMTVVRPQAGLGHPTRRQRQPRGGGVLQIAEHADQIHTLPRPDQRRIKVRHHRLQLRRQLRQRTRSVTDRSRLATRRRDSDAPRAARRGFPVTHPGPRTRNRQKDTTRGSRHRATVASKGRNNSMSNRTSVRNPQSKKCGGGRESTGLCTGGRRATVALTDGRTGTGASASASARSTRHSGAPARPRQKRSASCREPRQRRRRRTGPAGGALGHSRRATHSVSQAPAARVGNAGTSTCRGHEHRRGPRRSACRIGGTARAGGRRRPACPAAPQPWSGHSS
jgi:hypothetical protein